MMAPSQSASASVMTASGPKSATTSASKPALRKLAHQHQTVKLDLSEAHVDQLQRQLSLSPLGVGPSAPSLSGRLVDIETKPDELLRVVRLLVPDAPSNHSFATPPPTKSRPDVTPPTRVPGDDMPLDFEVVDDFESVDHGVGDLFPVARLFAHTPTPSETSLLLNAVSDYDSSVVSDCGSVGEIDDSEQVHEKALESIGSLLSLVETQSADPPAQESPAPATSGSEAQASAEVPGRPTVRFAADDALVGSSAASDSLPSPAPVAAGAVAVPEGAPSIATRSLLDEACITACLLHHSKVCGVPMKDLVLTDQVQLLFSKVMPLLDEEAKTKLIASVVSPDIAVLKVPTQGAHK